MNVEEIERSLYLKEVPVKHTRQQLLTYALASRGKGFICEFGVAAANTLRFIAKEVAPELVHGFDSFEGLPEDWIQGNDKGKYAVDENTVQFPENSRIHKGMFDDTIPQFLRSHRNPIGFLHVDCDLYSFTRSVLFGLRSRLVSGTVILFDELLAYHGFEEHEIKAFAEFLNETGMTYKPLGRVASAESRVWSNAQGAIVLQ